jgi:hypothetical protein
MPITTYLTSQDLEKKDSSIRTEEGKKKGGRKDRVDE